MTASRVAKNFHKALAMLILLGNFNCVTASPNPICADSWKSLERKFEDFEGNLEEKSRVQRDLLASCVSGKEFCAVVEDSDPSGLSVINGETLDVLRKMDKGKSTVSGVANFNSPKYGHVCALIRYSGGTSTAWMVRAWTLRNGKLNNLPTDQIAINGENLRPSEIFGLTINKINKLNN